MRQLSTIVLAGLLALTLISFPARSTGRQPSARRSAISAIRSVATLAAPTTITASAPARGGSRIVCGGELAASDVLL
jgi:hypothetical protein